MLRCKLVNKSMRQHGCHPGHVSAAACWVRRALLLFQHMMATDLLVSFLFYKWLCSPLIGPWRSQGMDFAYATESWATDGNGAGAVRHATHPNMRGFSSASGLWRRCFNASSRSGCSSACARLVSQAAATGHRLQNEVMPHLLASMACKGFQMQPDDMAALCMYAHAWPWSKK